MSRLLLLSLAVISQIAFGDTLENYSVPNPGFEHALTSSASEAWKLGEHSHAIARDFEVKRNGNASLRFDSTEELKNSVARLLLPIELVRNGVFRFSGHVRTDRLFGGATLYVRIDKADGEYYYKNTLNISSGTQDWSTLDITTPVIADAVSAEVGLLVWGDGSAWFDDLHFEPVKTSATAIDVAAPHEGDDTGQLHRSIAAIGYVWGYLKYHHPYMFLDCGTWDTELVAVIKRIQASNGQRPIDDYVQNWTERANRNTAANPEINALMQHSQGIAVPQRQPSATAFGAEMASVLTAIRRDHVPEPQACMELGINSAGNALFGKERSYKDLSPPDEYYRMVALMRFWNMVEYWFPYRDLIDEDWHTVLVDSVEEFLAADTQHKYQTALFRLIARIDDTHASLWSGWDAKPPGGPAIGPVAIRNVEGRPYVWKHLDTYTPVDESGVRTGDVILMVGGKRVEELLDAWRPYYGVSNNSAFLRDTYRYLLRGSGESLDVTVERAGKSVDVVVPLVSMRHVDRSPTNSNERDGATFQVLDSDIAYLKLSTLEDENLARYVDEAMGKRGLIVDIRGYPRSFVVFSLGQHLVNIPTPFAKFTWPNPHRPGEFHWSRTLEIQPKEPMFEGPVVVLVNESSQSQSEYTAMAFRASPNAVVIGSQTAGADGNMSLITLPGGEKTAFSGLGVFYPDKSPTQQIGIVPDYVVHPTVDGLREGQDEVLNAAIRFIESGSLE